MSNFSPEEIADRIELCKPIVEGAYAIKGVALSQEKIAEFAVHWEASLSGVPTEHLDELYRLGLRHKCQTAAQFENVWEMQVEAEARRIKLVESAKVQPKQDAPGAPDFVKEWANS